MNSVMEFYKTLSLYPKIQTLRTMMFIQVFGFHLIWFFVTYSQVRFYLETWIGVSWFLVIILLLVEITYEVKTIDH